MSLCTGRHFEIQMHRLFRLMPKLILLISGAQTRPFPEGFGVCVCLDTGGGYLSEIPIGKGRGVPQVEYYVLGRNSLVCRYGL